MKINLQSRTRRELADHIGEILGAIPRYLGVPTCNYQIGDCILEYNGSLTLPDNINATTLLNHLKEHGWESKQTVLQFLFQEIFFPMRNLQCLSKSS